MLKKTIQYKDLDGNTLVEDFYFNLTTAELAETELVNGADSLREMLESLMKAKENKKILQLFKDIIASTVGQRHIDGKRFVKSDEIRDSFMQSEAYSELIMEFFTNPGSVVEFIKAVIPANLSDQMPDELPKTLAEAMAMKGMEPKKVVVDEMVNFGPVPSDDESNGASVEHRERTIDEYSDQELKFLPEDLFKRLMGKEWGNLPKRVLVIAMQRGISK